MRTTMDLRTELLRASTPANADQVADLAIADLERARQLAGDPLGRRHDPDRYPDPVEFWGRDALVDLVFGYAATWRAARRRDGRATMIAAGARRLREVRARAGRELVPEVAARVVGTLGEIEADDPRAGPLADALTRWLDELAPRRAAGDLEMDDAGDLVSTSAYDGVDATTQDGLCLLPFAALAVAVARHDPPMLPCPCGCSLRSAAPTTRLCGCCGKHRPVAHWDDLYGACDGCAWCQSLGCDPCCHGACYEPIAASNARVDAARVEDLGDAT